MSEYVKLFQSVMPDNLRRESDETITIPTFTVVEEKSQFLIDFINNIGNKSVDELNSFILRYHTSFLNYRLFTESDASRRSMQGLFTNANFLNLLFNSISKLQLDSYEIAFLNRITYDYWSLSNKDINVCNILLQISGYINGNLIIKLSSKLGNNEAKVLAMISNSTDNQEVRIHRINRFLVNCDNPILEVQSMIDIMFFLYDRFLYPIIYTLLEAENCCKTEDNIPQYHKLMNAIITILLSTTSEKMIKIITEYGYIINSGKATPSIRLKEIGDERLNEVISKVEEDPLIKEIP
jgi:hypothetical protein